MIQLRFVCELALFLLVIENILIIIIDIDCLSTKFQPKHSRVFASPQWSVECLHHYSEVFALPQLSICIKTGLKRKNINQLKYSRLKRELWERLFLSISGIVRIWHS